MLLKTLKCVDHIAPVCHLRLDSGLLGISGEYEMWLCTVFVFRQPNKDHSYQSSGKLKLPHLEGDCHLTCNGKSHHMFDGRLKQKSI